MGQFKRCAHLMGCELSAEDRGLDKDAHFGNQCELAGRIMSMQFAGPGTAREVG